MKKFTHVGFDWNGTMIPDFMPCVESDNFCLELLGLPPVTPKIFRDTFIFPVSEYYQRLGAKKEDIERLKHDIVKVFMENYEKKVVRIRTRRGLRNLLVHLQSRKITNFLLSNHFLSDIEFHLERLNLSSYFAAILCNQRLDKTMGRSKDARLKEYLEVYKVDPVQAMLIGDTCEEIELARRFGLFSVAITDGYVSIKKLKAAKPDILVSNLAQIIEFID